MTTTAQTFGASASSDDSLLPKDVAQLSVRSTDAHRHLAARIGTARIPVARPIHSRLPGGAAARPELRGGCGPACVLPRGRRRPPEIPQKFGGKFQLELFRPRSCWSSDLSIACSVAAAARFGRESEAGREGIICRSQTSHTPPHTLRTSLASRPIRLGGDGTDCRVSFGHTSAGVEQVSENGRPIAAQRLR